MDAYIFTCKNVDQRIKDFEKTHSCICIHSLTGIFPWNTIDMDFMNLNQSAHGDREFGFIMSRMRMNSKVVTGHWKDPQMIAIKLLTGQEPRPDGTTGRVQNLYGSVII